MTYSEIEKTVKELEALNTPNAASLARKFRRRYLSKLSHIRSSITLRSDDYVNIVKAAAMYGSLATFTVHHNKTKKTVTLSYFPVSDDRKEDIAKLLLEAIPYLEDLAVLLPGGDDSDDNAWSVAALRALIARLQAASGAAKHNPSKR